MKKIKFISALALTLVMASCDNFDLPNPPGQSNAEPDAIYNDYTGLGIVQADPNINLLEANNNFEYVTVAKISELVDFPADYALSVDMQVAPSSDFKTYTTIETTVEGDAITVNPDLFNGAIQQVITKQPGVVNAWCRFVAYASLGSTRIRLGGLDKTYTPGEYIVTTLNPSRVIEDSYYFVPCKADGSLDFAAAKVMANTRPGTPLYDNPEFAVKIDVTAEQAAAGLLWKVVPASSYQAQSSENAYGCLPDEENPLEGKLVAQYGPGTISISGSLLVSANLETETYSVLYAYENLYPVSGRTSITNVMMLYTNDYVNYSGVSAANAYFTLYTDVNKSVTITQDPDVEPVVSENGLSMTGSLVMGDGGVTIKTPVSGNTLYWMNINLVQLTFSVDALQTLSVIGSGNGWDLTTATTLTHSSDLKTWTAKDVYIGDMFKINANGAWDISFGGQPVQDVEGEKVYQVYKADGGGDMSCEPGTYDVTLDFSSQPYMLTLKKK